MSTIHIPASYAPPHSPIHELDVISSFLNEPYLFEEYPHLTSDHFHLPMTRAIFTAAQAIRQRIQADKLDMSTLQEEANKFGTLEAMGGQTGLEAIYGRGTFIQFMPTHIGKLNEYHAKRLAIAAGMELVRCAYEGEVEDVLENSGAPMTAIHEAVSAIRPALSTKDIIGQSFAAYEKRLKKEESPMGIPTLPEIDALIRGVHPGRVYIIAAPTGGGKSVLASQIITLQALDGHPVLEINYEMKERDSMDRKIIQMSRVPSKAFMDPIAYGNENGVPPINEGFMRALKRTHEALSAAPIYIRKPGNRQLRTLAAMIRKEHRKHGVKVVAIDYLQKVRCKAASREAEIEEISGVLFDLAGELGLSIFLLSQVNGTGDTKHGIVASEDCDGFFLIERENNKEAHNFGEHYGILLAKDRHCGNTGKNIPLIFDADAVRFVHGFNEKKKTKKAKVDF